MGAKTIFLKNNLNSPTFYGAIIEKGVTFILLFTPLAIGTVQQWSISIMEIASFIILCAWLLKMAAEGRIVALKTSITGFLIALILLTTIQILPLPDSLMAFVSPSTHNIYETFIDNGVGMWRTISLNPDATKEELLKLLAYAAIFLVVINHYQTKTQLESIIRTIIYMGCFLAIFAVIQKMSWNGRLYWFYPVGEGLRSDNLYIWGPYINHNHFAGYMGMVIPLGMGLLLHKISNINSLPGIPWSRRIARFLDRKDSIAVVFLLIAILIMTAVLFLSLSRGGIIGFTASVLFFVGMIRCSRSLKRKTWFLMLLGLIIFLVVIVASWGRIEERFKEIGEEGKIKRIEVWADTINIVRDFPILGTGLGTFKNIYPYYQTKNPRLLFEHTENDYLEILTDMGFAGFFIIIGMASVFFYSIIKLWRQRHNNYVKCIVAGGVSSCVAIVVHSFTDFNLRIPANMMLLTVIAAVTQSAVLIPTEKKAYNDRQNI